MISVLVALLLWAPPPPASLDQVKAEANPERRARAAIDFAVLEEKLAEAAYSSGDLSETAMAATSTADAMQIARDALAASGKKAGRSPGPYKYGEQRSRELLVRFGDLERKMDSTERQSIEGPVARVQEIHDAWLESIMGKEK